MLALYGHPFSSYTWKVLIALYAGEVDFEFRLLDPTAPDSEHNRFVAANGGPLGKFPVLVDGDNILFESTTIIEYLARHKPAMGSLLPEETDAAIGVRLLDRVFDNYVMAPTGEVIGEYLRPEANRDLSRCDAARARLERSYRWLDGWLEYYPAAGQVTLVECAAAPMLHYAHWVHPIAACHARLSAWQAHLEALPPVRRCIEDARPYRPLFPVPMPPPA